MFLCISVYPLVSVYLFVRLSVYVYIFYLPVSLTVRLYVYMSVCQFICLSVSVCLYVSLSVCLSVCSICLSVRIPVVVVHRRESGRLFHIVVSETLKVLEAVILFVRGMTRRLLSAERRLHAR